MNMDSLIRYGVAINIVLTCILFGMVTCGDEPKHTTPAPTPSPTSTP